MNGHMRTARILTNLLENKFKFLGFRFGLDPIIGFVPVIGDFIGLGLSVYIILIAFSMHVPGTLIAQMLKNVVIDFIIGSIPVIGDITDFFYKASSKNLRLLEEYVESRNNIVEGEIIAVR
jgi:hypothetical protein